MGLITIVSKKPPYTVKNLKTSNNEIRITNNKIRVSQTEYTSNQL